MRHHIRLLVVSLAALIGASPALAERQVNETVAVKAGSRVSIELVAGSVRFIGWDRDEVQITGTLEDDVEGLDIDSGDNHVAIEVELVDKRNIHDASARLEIRVPGDARLEAESVSASLGVEGVRGAVSLESVNGDIVVESDVAEANLSSVSGNVRVESGATLGGGSFETVSGDIDFRGDLAPSGRFSFESVSGNVTVKLPPSVSAEFRVETFSGDIDNELGPPAEKSGPFVPSKHLRFSAGSGAARVSIESFSGNIRLSAR